MYSDPTVFVVDDDAAMRDSLRRLISAEGLRVETKQSAEAFLADIDPQRPGCLVLDVKMHGKSGLDLQDELVRRDAMRPIIFITAHADVPMAVRALKGGAIDFLQKPFRSQVLMERIRQALERDRTDRDRRAEQAEQAELAERLACLTPREVQVVERVVLGRTSREIADDLGVATKTVQAHRASAMARLGAGSAAELVRLAVLAGMRPAQSPNGRPSQAAQADSEG